MCVVHKLGSSCHECLFEGLTALKRIQMGDRDDDSALYGGAGVLGLVFMRTPF